jgi:acetyl-CoA carboxylase biotin carboxyl carrier protein
VATHGQTPETASLVDQVEALADRVLPALIEQLSRSELGELEVSRDGWRVRIRRDLGSPDARAQASEQPGSSGGAAVSGTSLGTGAAAQPGSSGSRSSVARRAATSPAVGYFSPRDGLATGQAVRAGDLLGSVNVLGLPQAVHAPADGVVGRVLASAGEAVEYGQELVRIDGIERLVEA